MSTHSLGRLERGERRPPSIIEIRTWASVLQVDEAVLVDLRSAELAVDTTRGPASGEALAADMAHVWPELPPARLMELYARARQAIVIWESWLPDAGVRLRRALTAAVGQGATVRIILADPAGPAAIGRARAFGFQDPAPYLHGTFARLIGELQAVPSLDPTAVLRLSPTLPPCPLYGTEERMLLSWFYPDTPSIVLPTVEVETVSLLGRTMADAFDRQWEALPPPEKFVAQQNG
jgi:hypothetical protein